MAAIVFSILTVGGYIVAWAVYLEKKFTAVMLPTIAINFNELIAFHFRNLYWEQN